MHENFAHVALSLEKLAPSIWSWHYSYNCFGMSCSTSSLLMLLSDVYKNTCNPLHLQLNPIALSIAKTPSHFGHSECNMVNWKPLQCLFLNYAQGYSVWFHCHKWNISPCLGGPRYYACPTALSRSDCDKEWSEQDLHCLLMRHSFSIVLPDAISEMHGIISEIG